MEIALYQPDIAGNAGAIARLCACLGAKLTIIEPAGFQWDDSRLRRAGMDYLEIAAIRRSASWQAFCVESAGRRRVLLTTRTETSYTDFAFKAGDILLMGRESSGVPADVHAACEARITIPMQPGARSLNVAMAAAMALSEMKRQLGECRPIS